MVNVRISGISHISVTLPKDPPKPPEPQPQHRTLVIHDGAPNTSPPDLPPFVIEKIVTADAGPMTGPPTFDPPAFERP